MQNKINANTRNVAVAGQKQRIDAIVGAPRLALYHTLIVLLIAYMYIGRAPNLLLWTIWGFSVSMVCALEDYHRRRKYEFGFIARLLIRVIDVTTILFVSFVCVDLIEIFSLPSVIAWTVPFVCSLLIFLVYFALSVKYSYTRRRSASKLFLLLSEKLGGIEFNKDMDGKVFVVTGAHRGIVDEMENVDQRDDFVEKAAKIIQKMETEHKNIAVVWYEETVWDKHFSLLIGYNK